MSFFWELRYHPTCANGSKSNQESTTNILSTLQKNEHIASIWSFSLSRRRWSSWIQNAVPDVCLIIRVFTALVNSHMASLFCKDDKVPRRDSSIAWISTQPILSSTFEQFQPIWTKSNWSSIARQHDVIKRLRRVHLPRWKFPRHAFHHLVRIDSWWKDAKKRETQVFFTAVNLMFAHLHKSRDYDVTEPRVAVHKHNWKLH